jgi:CRP-like cAMP-binding protein
MSRPAPYLIAMHGFSQIDRRNSLIGAFTPADVNLVTEECEHIALAPGDVLGRTGEPADWVYFPDGAATSIVDLIGAGRRIEIGLVGREGMIGWPGLLGSQTWPHDAIVAIGCASALKVETARVADLLRVSPRAQALLLAFVQAFTLQMSRTIGSGLHDPVERRLARWLLMCRDRLDEDRIEVTHHQLAASAGVRRATVTDSLHILEGRGLLRNCRGWVAILDRPALEALAGDTYGFAEAEYRRMLDRISDAGATDNGAAGAMAARFDFQSPLPYMKGADVACDGI